MCGIAGVAGVGNSSQAQDILQRMVTSLAHRGPDSEGMERWPGAVLGHRRLAIIDLSDAGKQPMLSDDRETGLVFNGCIYNFLELRSELEREGHRFRSQCDTEVLLRGYQQWGIDKLVPRLRGMFAFGVWDNRQRKLTLVRDRLGVKPLVYAMQNGAIAFGSTVTAVRESGFVQDLDPEALLEFLEFGWISDDLTIYSGARKVPAAGIVEWQNGRISERSYWSPPEPDSRKMSYHEAVERTEALLIESVKLRLIADVPVGSLLSGGIDSALICWAVAKLNANLKAFTVSTPGHPADEAEDARKTARLLGIPHEVIELDPSEQPAVRDLTCAYGEPFACSSALAMLRVCKAVKPKVTVLLTGDGGDDVFLGYKHHGVFHTAQRFSRMLPPMTDSLWWKVRPAIAGISALRRPMHLTDYAVGGLAAVTRTHDGLPYYERAGILGERLAGRQLSHRQMKDSFASGKSLMRDFLDYERKTRFVAEYMTKVDGAAMFYAMEARSPFLDHVMWELAASLPVETRLKNGELKSVLREVVRKNIGPEVAHRKKQGFTVPVGDWLVANWRPQLESIVGESVLEKEGWLRRDALRGAVATAISRGKAPVQLWTLVVLENWLRENQRSPVAAMSF